MQITARIDYAVRAMLAIAAAHPAPMTMPRLAQGQSLPPTYLASILTDLRRTGLLQARRGTVAAGYTLNRPAAEITVGCIVRALDGPPRSIPTQGAVYGGPASSLPRIWQAANVAMLGVVDNVTLADVVMSRLPANLSRPACPHCLDGQCPGSAP